MPKRLFLLILVPFWAIPASAAGDAAGLMVSGRVLGLDTRAGTIVFCDTPYYLSETTHIERDDGRTGSVSDLLKGQRVGLGFRVEDGRYRVLTSVRVMPESADADSPPSGVNASGTPSAQ